jgi:hypothetical protein
MASLPKELRNQLARVTLAARAKAEEAALAALENLAVHERDPRAHMSPDQRQLRNRLRARGRALGDSLDPGKGTQEIARLVELVAYENWHRMLFTRFLTANGLLISDDSMGNVPVTLEDCEELASSMGARDGFDLACRFASQTLPGVFRKDDPALEVTLAPNDRVALRELLDSLDDVIFQADDSLGWTYQFWQAQRKEDINDSGSKIGADELPAVTQLFTEDYMVEFLLHNTLGAWWAGKRGPITAASESEARRQVSLPAKDGVPGLEWPYLRFVQDETAKTWRPAAGTFEGWPKTVREVTVLDPCMGSGHFLAFVLPIIVRLRMEEQGLSGAEAVAAAIRDNVHGLELDPRCTQIGAFNVALTAWKLSGFQTLPPLHIACSGLAPNIPEADWIVLAGSNEKLRNGMERLYRLFENAPVLGSLINPRAEKGRLLAAGYQELQPLLEKAVAKESKDDTANEMAVTARGLAKAAELLAGSFTLVATNVPFLGYREMGETLLEHVSVNFPNEKGDLGYCLWRRFGSFVGQGSTTALVTLQHWLSLRSYLELRKHLLATSELPLIAHLGTGAFETIKGEKVNVTLTIATKSAAAMRGNMQLLDAASCKGLHDKANHLREGSIGTSAQSKQYANPDHRISFGAMTELPTLSTYADCLAGIMNGDSPKFIRNFWEMPVKNDLWAFLQSTAPDGAVIGGLESVIFFDESRGHLREEASIRRIKLHNADERGNSVWGRAGVAISQMSSLPASRYFGNKYDSNVAAIVPRKSEDLAAIWAFCSSTDFYVAVRAIDRKLNVTNATFGKVPFDLAHWGLVAAQKYPHGLEKPRSSVPTQWLLSGHPKDSDSPLHVAAARLVGYQWPRQTGSEFPDCPALGPDGLEQLADEDGIVCLPALNKEQPAASRLRNMLAAALGSYSEASLLAEADAKSKTLEDWLRNEFFEQHCKLFHNRPFIWHIWDGRKDGFAAIVNYHRLDHNALKKLTYSYLGDWIRQQQDDVRDDKAGAAERLGAAQELQAELAAILGGEAPYDIFVRWKPLSQQTIGWHPDLNDGVRLNIRPFLMAQDVGKKGAGVLRAKPNIKWDKDRGKEPKRDKADFPWFWCEAEPEQDPAGEREFAGHRWNDVHLSLAHKRASRK